MTKFSSLRAFALGCLVSLGLGMLLAAASVVGPHAGAWAHLTRAFDSFAPHLLLFVLAIVGAVFMLGARWIGLVLLTLCLAIAAPIARTHWAQSLPLADQSPSNLRVLWFNVFAHNAIAPETLFAELRATGADIVILAETFAIKSQLATLRADYPYVLGCERICEVLVLSKLPLQNGSIRNLGPVFKERLAFARLAPKGAQSVALNVVHMTKPWYLGLTEREDHTLHHRLEEQAGPRILVGDFNAAPWSHRVKRLLPVADLKGLRYPVSTWPVAAGPFGLPIDQFFVGGGVRIVAAQPWGHDLGSNHLGVLADLYIPPAPAQ